ncbi:MAG: hypothetical protein JWN52_4540 [Actinomycetia bacterium]|nr:hypothetical protein [Actinomycetes bacterium]
MLSTWVRARDDDGAWGFSTGGIFVRIVLGVGAPLVAAVLWGLFAAPKAKFKVPLAGVLLVKALVFGAAAVALYALGRHGLGIGCAVIALLNTALATIDRRALMHALR